MFSDAGPDVRWCGNEKRSRGDPNWSTVDPAIVHVSRRRRSGRHRRRCSTAIRTAPCGARPKPTPRFARVVPSSGRGRACEHGGQLVDLYFTSVGRNAKLLLNVPPTREACFTTGWLA